MSSLQFQDISFLGNIFPHQIVYKTAGMGFSSLSFSPISAVTSTRLWYKKGAQQKTMISQLERVQNKALRQVLGVFKTTPSHTLNVLEQ